MAEESIPFEDRMDKIHLTGMTAEGAPVALTLLPEEVEYIRRDDRDSHGGCTHLEVFHHGDMAYGCDIPDCGCGDGQGL